MSSMSQIQPGQRHSRQKSPGSLSGFAPLGQIGALPTLGASRARPDILPEHESRHPATDELRAAIEADWDGTAGGARDLGLRFRNAAGEPCPSWRIADIAQQMGIYAAKVSARMQANLDALYPEPTLPPGARLSRRMPSASRAERARGNGGRKGQEGVAEARGARGDRGDTADGDNLTHGVVPVRSLADALERVNEQLASGDGDTGILTIERDALSDLAARRAGMRGGVSGGSSEERTERDMIPVIPAHPAMATEPLPPVESEAAAAATGAPHVGDTRQATCEHCGQPFTSQYRGGKQGWSRYCSSACGGKARWQGVSRAGERHQPYQRKPVAATQITSPPADVHLQVETPITPEVAAALSAEAAAAIAGAAFHVRTPTPILAVPPSQAPVMAAHDVDQWRAVTLASGGVITVSVTGNILAFKPEERALLFTLIERLDRYEADLTNRDAE